HDGDLLPLRRPRPLPTLKPEEPKRSTQRAEKLERETLSAHQEGRRGRRLLHAAKGRGAAARRPGVSERVAPTDAGRFRRAQGVRGSPSGARRRAQGYVERRLTEPDQAGVPRPAAGKDGRRFNVTAAPASVRSSSRLALTSNPPCVGRVPKAVTFQAGRSQASHSPSKLRVTWVKSNGPTSRSAMRLRFTAASVGSPGTVSSPSRYSYRPTVAVSPPRRRVT